MSDAAQAAARLAVAVGTDVRLQWRNRFYLVYLLISVGYIAGLLAAPREARPLALGLLLFSDPAVLGFFFIGALVFLERGDGTLAALAVTPLGTAEYVASKVLSLTVLALAACVGITAAVRGGEAHYGWLVVGVVLTSASFVLLGLVAATRTGTVNRYMLSAPLWTPPLLLPLAEPLGLVESKWLMALPTGAGLHLILGAVGAAPAEPATLTLASAVLVVWIAATYLWARCWFERYVLGRRAAEAR